MATNTRRRVTDVRHSTPLELRFVPNERGGFSGYASLFDTPDAMGDVIVRGAFRRSLAEHRAAGTAPLMLWQHYVDEPIGRWVTLEEDARGLRVEGSLVLETARGSDAYRLLKAGALDGLSIGFRVRDSERRRGGGRLIRELELVEVSLVSLPAASRARVTDVRSTNAAARAASADQGETAMDDETRAAEDGQAASNDDVPARVGALESRLEEMDGRLATLDESVTATRSATGRIEARLNRPGAAVERREEPADFERRAFATFLRRGREALRPDEVRAVRESSDGGFLAFEGFAAELARNLVEFSPIRRYARVTPTSEGSVVMPVRTGGPTAKWQPDGQSEGTESSYAQRRFLVEQLTAHTDVSNSLLEDSAFDLEAELRRDFAEEFGRAEGLAFVHGDGTGQPQGLLHAGVEPAIETVANGGTSNLTAEGIIKLYHALPQFYAANAVWMMNRSTMGAMRALSFPGGTAFVWTENLALGNPPTLLGRPVVEVPDMPDMASGSTPIAFGDLSQAYRIFDRVSLSVLRDPYSVQTQGLVRFHARRRVGGGVVKSEAVKLLKMVAS